MSNKAQNASDMIWREDRYRDVLREPEKNAILVRIWRDAFAGDYPEDADPFGFVTCNDLEKFASSLKVGPGETVLDIGCGRGGPGLWVARKTGASVIGLDILPEAIDQANAAKERQGQAVPATFASGSFVKTGLSGSSVQAIMSVDAFWMVLDKTGALREMARVIETGRRFAMTTWVPAYLNLESMLRQAGFQLLMSEETINWKERQLAVYRGILENRKEIDLAMGTAASATLIAEAEIAPDRLAEAPRFFVVAERIG